MESKSRGVLGTPHARGMTALGWAKRKHAYPFKQAGGHGATRLCHPPNLRNQIPLSPRGVTVNPGLIRASYGGAPHPCTLVNGSKS